MYSITDDNMNEVELDTLINQLENAPMLLLSTPSESVHFFHYWDLVSYIEQNNVQYYCIQAI